MYEYISPLLHWEKNAIESIVFVPKACIVDSNQCAIELITYLFVLVVYFYELIVHMLSVEMLLIQ